MSERTVVLCKDLLSKFEAAVETDPLPKGKFSVEEEELLIKYHDKVSVAKIAELLGRCTSVIYVKLKKLRCEGRIK